MRGERQALNLETAQEYMPHASFMLTTLSRDVLFVDDGDDDDDDDDDNDDVSPEGRGGIAYFS